MRGYWFLSLNYTYWSLETIRGYPKAPSTPLLIFGNWSAFLLYIFCLFLYEVGDSVKYSSDTSSFTLSRGLVLPFWSLTLISSPSHRPSTFELCDLLMPLSQASGASKLCRWLGGSVQRIKHSLFYSVIRSQIILTSLRLISILSVFLYSLLILYQI